MTDKEKLEKIKILADAMYNKMQNLTTDTSGIWKAMDDYHQFVILHYHKEEPASKDLEEAAGEAFKQIVDADKNNFLEIFKAGANWKEEQIMKDAIDTTIKQGCIELGILIKGLDKGKFSFGDKVKVIIIKEDDVCL